MIEEDGIKIFTFSTGNQKGPGKKLAGFYNPTWRLDRRIQVIFCKYAYEQGATKFLDGMAATGIRGIRIKKMLGDVHVDINDSNKKSYEIILRNVRENEIDADVTNEKFCSLLNQRKYDYIDLDPYGSPAKYIPCIFEGARKKTFVSISATDVATLSGVFKKACIKRYGAIPLKFHGAKEIGLRILLGYVARIASIFDYSFKPILSYHYAHYFRVYGVVEKGAKKAERNITAIGWFYWDDGWKVKKYEKPPSGKLAGPLWIKNLHEHDFIQMLSKEEDKKIKSLAEKFIKENEIATPYYESHRIAKEISKKQPRLHSLIEKLRQRGWRAARTHFAGDGFKTDAGYEEIKNYF